MDGVKQCITGMFYSPGRGFHEGWVMHDGIQIIERGDGKPPKAPDLEGVVLPSLVDAHTHVGDAVARGIDLTGKTLADVVAPPDGLKHRILRDAPEEERLAAMRATVSEMVDMGVRAFIDFREGGVAGAALLRRAVAGFDVDAVVLGRPAKAWDDEEAGAILDVADGFGLSALADVADDTPERMAAMAHRRDKRFALHLSEAVREDAARALDLEPDFLVHCVYANEDDLAAIAGDGVPIVVCPRSNALFGQLPDVGGMLDAGIDIALGSDNAMFHPLDVLLDARLLRRAAPDVAPESLLDAVIEGGRRIVGEDVPDDYYAPGMPADLVVYAPTGASAIDSLLGVDVPRVLHGGAQR